MTLSVWICQKHCSRWSGWLSHETSARCGAGALQSFCFIGSRICIVQLYSLNVTENQETVSIGRQWVITFLGLEVSCWLVHKIRFILSKGYTVLQTKSPSFVLWLLGSILETAAMFNRIWSVRLIVCKLSQRFCISWLIVGDGVSCCGKGRAGSVTEQGRCGHA